jgi:hypothetical protein
MRVHLLSLFLAAFLPVLFSCNSDKLKQGISRQQHVKTILVPDVKPEEVVFEKVIEHIEIIPLETNVNSLFRDVRDFIYQNEKFYVLDVSMEVFVFTASGRFLYRLDKKGNGPGEYREIRDFEVNDEGDLYILSYQKILVYDSLRNLKKTISLSPLMNNGSISPVGMAFAFDNGYYLYVGAFGVNELTPGRYSIYKVDGNGNFKGDVFFPLRNNDAEHPRFFKLAGEQAYIFTPIIGNDTIYKFTPKDVYPVYYLDYGERKMPAELYTGFHLGKKRLDAQNNTDVVVSTLSVIETSKFLRFIYEAKNNLYEVVYSKTSGNFATNTRGGEYGVRNYFPYVQSGIERTFYGTIDAYLLINSKRTGEFRRKFGYLENYEELEAVIDKIHENDNRVMMAVTYKDF